jgi:hypothetical protein
MGKRELLLICAFVMVGAVVYYATAPAADPGSRGFSTSRILDEIRREVRGNRASAEADSSTTIPLTAGVTELRFEIGSAPLTVTGEDRTDVACDLHVWSSGYDENEAKKYAAETALKTTESGSSLSITIKYPEPATQRATLTVRVPRGLAIRIQPSRGKLDITGVSSVELVEARGQVNIQKVSGRAVVNHRGGQMAIDGVAMLKLTSRGSEIELKNVAGDATLQLQAGELRAESLTGPVEVESNGTRMTFEHFDTMRRPLRVNAVGGNVTLKGIRGETRVDGRDTRIEAIIDKPAPIAIYNEGDEPMDVTLPTGGFQLDALATDGRLSVPEGSPSFPSVQTTENEQRASGRVGSGGPTITLRAARGNITIKGTE